MPTHKLQFQDVRGNSTVFVDPLNVSNAFVHKSEKVRKNIASLGRVSFYRNEFSQTRQYHVENCETGCKAVLDDVHGRVILSGASSEEVLKNWEDMKANVDIAIASGVLNGLRMPLTVATLVVTDAPVPAVSTP